MKCIVFTMNLVLFLVVATTAPSSAVATEEGSPVKSKLQRVRPVKLPMVGGFYYSLPHEASTPHQLEECPKMTAQIRNEKIGMPNSGKSECALFETERTSIKANRCVSKDGKFVYMIFAKLEDCRTDRAAALASEE